jgi:flagellar hook-basal body complex protein FliE
MPVTSLIQPLLAMPATLERKPPEPQAQVGSEFQRLLTETQRRQGQADVKVQQALLGKEDLHEAMLALEKANLSLKVLVQVRNKLLQAYEELSRMPM